MKYFKKLSGNLLYLSPSSTEDALQYTSWCNNDQLSDFIDPDLRVVSLVAAQEELKKKLESHQAMAVIENGTDKLIGIASLSNLEHRIGNGNLNIFLESHSYWSNGYADEVVTLMLDYGFNIHNLNNILIKLPYYTDDILQCYGRHGFKICACRRQAVIKGNIKSDLLFMDLLAEEYDGPSLINFD